MSAVRYRLSQLRTDTRKALIACPGTLSMACLFARVSQTIHDHDRVRVGLESNELILNRQLQHTEAGLSGHIKGEAHGAHARHGDYFHADLAYLPRIGGP